MRLLPFFLLWILLVVSCSEDKAPKTEAKKAPVTKNKSVKKKKSSLIKMADSENKPKGPKDPITDENVVERLTAYGDTNRESIVDIYTSKGKIRARLYRDTPLHRANFIMMSKRGFLNNSIFTRCVPGFIAQSGGTFDEDQGRIKNEIGKYSIPAEFSRKHIHKQGAIAAARKYKDNPDKKSDAYAFYFVEGTIYNNPTLNNYEKENNYKFSQSQRDYYLENPGAAHLDGQHTVFGEVISGMSVVLKLTSVETDSRDWPRKDIFVDSVKVVR